MNQFPSFLFLTRSNIAKQEKGKEKVEIEVDDDDEEEEEEALEELEEDDEDDEEGLTNIGAVHVKPLASRSCKVLIYSFLSFFPNPPPPLIIT